VSIQLCCLCWVEIQEVARSSGRRQTYAMATLHVAGTMSMAGLDAVKARDLVQVFFRLCKRPFLELA
jgi:hypothetical protein